MNAWVEQEVIRFLAAPDQGRWETRGLDSVRDPVTESGVGGTGCEKISLSFRARPKKGGLGAEAEPGIILGILDICLFSNWRICDKK